jgi:hypothetical protein
LVPVNDLGEAFKAHKSIARQSWSLLLLKITFGGRPTRAGARQPYEGLNALFFWPALPNIENIMLEHRDDR